MPRQSRGRVPVTIHILPVLWGRLRIVAAQRGRGCTAADIIEEALLAHPDVRGAEAAQGSEKG